MRLEPPPRIDSAAWSLRPLEASDVAAWYAYVSVPAVVEHTSWNVKDPAELRALIEDCESDGVHSAVRYAIVDNQDRALIGTIGFPVISWLHHTAEVAYDIDPAWAGRGVATSCCRALTTWALNERGFVRIQATALDSNAASQRVLEKSGYALEGKLTNLKMVRNRPRDFYLYAKTMAAR